MRQHTLPKFILCLIPCFGLSLLAGCGSNQSPSEQYLQSVFDKLNIALSYERLCENSKHLESMDVNLAGNTQLASGLFSKELMKNNPAAKEQEITQLVTDRKALIDGRMEKILKEQGCDSVGGKDAAKFLDALLKMPPEAFSVMISSNLEKLNGKPPRPPEP